MSKRVRAVGACIALAIALSLALAACSPAQPRRGTSGQTTSTPAPASLAASLPPQPGPGEWATEISNPWFPLTPGTRFTYEGVKDGEATVDTYEVASRKRLVNGVRATVVLDTLRSGIATVEATEDWYAQDSAGNVWYLGESTKDFDKNGNVTSTEGSWEAGVDGAMAGLFMPADPKIGDSFYQEYYKGSAEDRYEIISVDSTVTVPYGSFSGVLVTRELTALEPDIVSEKYYVRNVGQVYENDVKGATEYNKLVSVAMP